MKENQEKWVKYAAIVPAAGLSNRMKRFKPLLPWPPGTGKLTVIESTVRSLLEAGIDTVVVVTGHRAAEVNRVLERYPVKTVYNPDSCAPMGSSIQLAMIKIPDAMNVLLLPGDHPAVKPETIRKLCLCHRENPDAIHIPNYRNRRGHPAVFPVRARPGLLHPDPDRGVRALFEMHFDVVDVAVTDSGVRINLDNPEDYQ
jgi:molybdenum cofactor cytidylyltransferase